MHDIVTLFAVSSVLTGYCPFIFLHLLSCSYIVLYFGLLRFCYVFAFKKTLPVALTIFETIFEAVHPYADKIEVHLAYFWVLLAVITSQNHIVAHRVI